MAKESIEQTRAWLNELEPSAVAASSGDTMAIEISHAISAKRQADALGEIAAALHPSNPLMQTLQSIEMNGRKN